MRLCTNRRSLLASFAVLGVMAANPSRGVARDRRAPAIAVTIDDFDLSDTPLMSGEERDAAIRAALNRHKIKAGGFVAGKYVNDSLSKRVLSAWSDADHIIGNHSFSHSYFSGSNPDALMADIMKCEPLLSEYPSFRRLFRFPYLAEGKSREGRDRMRMLLKQHEYANAHVTIDTSDWYIDNRLKARLIANPSVQIAPYKRFYLDHIWECGFRGHRAHHSDLMARGLPN